MELAEIHDFLMGHRPFSEMSKEQAQRVVRSVVIQYYRRGSMIVDAGQDNEWLSLIRSGAVELKLGGTDLNARLSEGDCFGYPSLLRGGPTQNQVIALEDCLLYRIPKQVFIDVHSSNAEFAKFFETDQNERLRRAVEAMKLSQRAQEADSSSAFASVDQLIRRTELVAVQSGATIKSAAILMTEKDVSTLLIYQNERLVGIVTDKDLRRRVLGASVSSALPISEVMTPNPITVAAHTLMLSALLIMLDRGIHHLPVVGAADTVIGIIGANDILARLGSNTLQIANQVRDAKSPQAVTRATAMLPQALTGLVDAGVDADHISRFVSTVGEQAHARLLQLAQDDLGAPPVPFALVCFGSLARSEQALGSDQDNGFILGEGYEPARHEAYFSELAKRLCDGLNSAGYVYCPGDIMATNPKYCRTKTQWLAHFSDWIERPEPEAILNSTIFFDMRGIAGDKALADQLRRDVFEMAKSNRIFQSFIARAAASTRIPLGFFRNLLLEHDAEEGHVLNLKHQGIAPIVDIARAYALANGHEETNSLERLQGAAAAGAMSEESASDLRDCFEFIRDIRFRHQREQIACGQPASNKLAPKNLSRFERDHLRDAFKIIREQLNTLRTVMAGGIS